MITGRKTKQNVSYYYYSVCDKIVEQSPLAKVGRPVAQRGIAATNVTSKRALTVKVIGWWLCALCALCGLTFLDVRTNHCTRVAGHAVCLNQCHATGGQVNHRGHRGHRDYRDWHGNSSRDRRSENPRKITSVAELVVQCHRTGFAQKFEIRSTKLKNSASHLCTIYLGFLISSLFRVSDFEFRILGKRIDPPF